MEQVFSIHWFRDKKFVKKTYERFVPRIGDTVRFDTTLFADVYEIVWCLDEPSKTRVNIGTRTVK